MEVCALPTLPVSMDIDLIDKELWDSEVKKWGEKTSHKGGPGSGFHSEDGHAGIPGKQGGSKNSQSLDVVDKKYDVLYKVGQSASKDGIDNIRDLVRSKYWDEIQYANHTGMVFVEAGLLGKPEPYYVNAWRYGKIPSSGKSYNQMTDKPENGVSVMEVIGGNKTQDLLSAAFISKGRKVVYLRGLLNTVHVGGDGEPLLLDPVEIDNPTQTTNDPSITKELLSQPLCNPFSESTKEAVINAFKGEMSEKYYLNAREKMIGDINQWLIGQWGGRQNGRRYLGVTIRETIPLPGDKGANRKNDRGWYGRNRGQRNQET